jgi:O-antigen/teichoic acid export membrane protein
MEDNRPTLIKQTVINYFNLIITYIIGFFSIFALTRILTVEEYGAYALLFTFATILGIFINLGIAEYIASQFGKFSSIEKAKRFNGIFRFSFITQFVFIFILYIFRFRILGLLNLQDYLFEYYVILIIIFNLALLRNIYSYYQSRKKLEFTAILNFLSLNLGTILFITYYLIIGTLNLKIAFFTWLAALVLSNFVGIMKILKLRIGLKIKAIIKPALQFSIPLIPFIIADSLIIFSDRFIINYLINTSEVAFYTLAYQLHSIIFSFGALIFILFLPYIAELLHKKKKIKQYINYSIKYCLLMVIPAITILSVLAPSIVTLVSGVKYIPSIKFIWFLAPFPLFATLLVLFYHLLWIKEKTKFLGIVYLIGGLLNIILNFILIIYFNSALGAAIATVITYLLLFILLFIKTNISIYLDYKFLKIGRIFTSSILAGFIISFIRPEYFIYKIITIILFFVIYIILLLILRTFVKDEKNILRIIKSKIF